MRTIEEVDGNIRTALAAKDTERYLVLLEEKKAILQVLLIFSVIRLSEVVASDASASKDLRCPCINPSRLVYG